MTGAVLVGSLGLGTGVALAVSGGPYQPGQQDCPVYGADYATPSGQVYPGCHNIAVNVENGGTTDGNPNSDNTRYVEFGNNQAPIDSKSQGTNTPLSLGEPGSTGSPHSGCVAVNTDGTNGGGTSSQPSSGSGQSSSAGCGNNSGGAGFNANYDYYQVYCPIASAAGFGCEDANPGTTSVTPDTGTGVAYQPILADGVLVYLGMDDNTDNGEHDGLGPASTCSKASDPTCNPDNAGAVNGPSDGGAIMLVLDPQKAGDTPSATNPEGAANASSGACADGICADATTQQETVYHGCGPSTVKCEKGTPSSSHVYDYAPGGNPGNDPSVYSESAGCNSGDSTTTSSSACGKGGMDAYRAATPSNVNAEPGVQVYADPDPQRSPADPAIWPTPAAYAGTCGVYAGSPATTGRIAPAGAPMTNAAGQVAVDPGTCA